MKKYKILILSLLSVIFLSGCNYQYDSVNRAKKLIKYYNKLNDLSSYENFTKKVLFIHENVDKIDKELYLSTLNIYDNIFIEDRKQAKKFLKEHKKGYFKFSNLSYDPYYYQAVAFNKTSFNYYHNSTSRDLFKEGYKLLYIELKDKDLYLYFVKEEEEFLELSMSISASINVKFLKQYFKISEYYRED